MTRYRPNTYTHASVSSSTVISSPPTIALTATPLVLVVQDGSCDSGIARIQRSGGERGDRVADQLGADHEAQDGHDRRVLAGHPVVQLTQDPGRALAHEHRDRDGHADAKRAEQHEDGERHGLPAR